MTTATHADSFVDAKQRRLPGGKAWGLVPLQIARFDSTVSLAAYCRAEALDTPPCLWRWGCCLPTLSWHEAPRVGVTLGRPNPGAIQPVWAYWPSRPALAGFAEADFKPAAIALVTSGECHLLKAGYGWITKYAIVQAVAVCAPAAADYYTFEEVRRCLPTRIPVVQWDSSVCSTDPLQNVIDEIEGEMKKQPRYRR